MKLSSGLYNLSIRDNGQEHTAGPNLMSSRYGYLQNVRGLCYTGPDTKAFSLKSNRVIDTELVPNQEQGLNKLRIHSSEDRTVVRLSLTPHSGGQSVTHAENQVQHRAHSGPIPGYQSAVLWWKPQGRQRDHK